MSKLVRTVFTVAASMLAIPAPVASKEASAPPFVEVALFKWPTTVGSVDVTTLLPNCPPVKCNVDVWILAVADFTGDGLSDVLLGTTLFDKKYKELDRPGPVILMKNSGNGSFERINFADGSPFILRQHPREASVADFNHDEKHDVFVVSNGYDAAPWKGERNLLLVQDGGTLRDKTDELPKITAMHHGVTSGDFSGHGNTDLFVITNHGSSRQNSYFLINDGNGRFTKSDLNDRFPPSFLKFEGPSIDRSKYDTARVMDLEGTGKSDILLAVSGDDAAHAASHSGFKESRIIYNDGANRWRRSDVVEFPTGPWKYSTFTTDIAVADVDKDGKTDILMATARRKEGEFAWLGFRLRLFLNKGNRKFEEVTATNLWNQSAWDDKEDFPIRVFLTDLNGDRFPDIVVSTFSPVRTDAKGEVPYVVALNDGGGHFTPVNPVDLAPPYRGRHLWPADIFGRGRIDLIGLSLLGVKQGADFFTKGVTIDLFEHYQ